MKDKLLKSWKVFRYPFYGIIGQLLVSGMLFANPGNNQKAEGYFQQLTV